MVGKLLDALPDGVALADIARILIVQRDGNISAAISGNDRWVVSSGSRRSSAAVSADAPPTLEPRSHGEIRDPGPVERHHDLAHGARRNRLDRRADRS